MSRNPPRPHCHLWVKKESCGKESLVDYGIANDSGSGGVKNIANVSGFREQVLPSVRTWARL